MKAKFIKEDVEDVFKPKSQKEVETGFEKSADLGDKFSRDLMDICYKVWYDAGIRFGKYMSEEKFYADGGPADKLSPDTLRGIGQGFTARDVVIESKSFRNMYGQGGSYTRVALYGDKVLKNGTQKSGEALMYISTYVKDNIQMMIKNKYK